ncbi:MAG: cell envelope integrity protein TolA [Candidatus Omnitrophota bacterium]
MPLSAKTDASQVKPTLNLHEFSIPRNIGTTKEVEVFDSEEVIINIKDAHDNLSAQESISDILDNLVTNYDVRTIAIEGSSGYIDTSIISSFPDKEIKKKLADELMAEGRISASEYFSIVTVSDVALYGIDDKSLHSKNMDAFRKALKKRESNYKKAQALYDALSVLCKHVYSDELRILEENSILSTNGNVGFTKRWEVIRKIGEKNGVAPDEYENINNLLKAIELEKKCDFKSTNTEREQLLNELKAVLETAKLEELILKSLSFKLEKISASMFYSHMTDLARYKNMDLSKYPNLQLYVEYMALYESVDIGAIKDEVIDYENKIKEKVFRNDDERQLSRLLRKASVMSDLVEVKLTSKSLQYYQDHKSEFNAKEFVDFIKRVYAKYKVALPYDLDVAGVFSAMPPAEEFYELTLKRNDAMVANTIKCMKEQGQTVAALVTGGFHSAGITEILKSKHLSYLVILPKFDKQQKRPYLTIITNTETSYKPLLDGGDFYIAIETEFSKNEFSFECIARLTLLLNNALKGFTDKMATQKMLRDYLSRYEARQNELLGQATDDAEKAKIRDNIARAQSFLSSLMTGVNSQGASWVVGYDNSGNAYAFFLKTENGKSAITQWTCSEEITKTAKLINARQQNEILFEKLQETGREIEGAIEASKIDLLERRVMQRVDQRGTLDSFEEIFESTCKLMGLNDFEGKDALKAQIMAKVEASQKETAPVQVAQAPSPAAPAVAAPAASTGQAASAAQARAEAAKQTKADADAARKRAEQRSETARKNQAKVGRLSTMPNEELVAMMENNQYLMDAEGGFSISPDEAKAELTRRGVAVAEAKKEAAPAAKAEAAEASGVGEEAVASAQADMESRRQRRLEAAKARRKVAGRGWAKREVQDSRLRDGVKLSEPVESRHIATAQRHIVAGDIHGDLDGLMLDLQNAGLIDQNGNWVGGDAVFVQMGDVIDRGSEGRAVDQFLRKLQKQAEAQGGKVVRLLGNHELMFLQGMLGNDGALLSWLRNGGTEILKELGVPESDMRNLQVLRANSALQKFFNEVRQDIMSGNIVAAYNAGGRIFVHGGVLPHISKGRQVSEVARDLNERLKSAVSQSNFSDEIFNVGAARGGRGLAGIFWADYSDLLDAEGNGQLELDQIVGHTPERMEGAEVRMSPDGKVINVDVGHVDRYGGNRGFLEIQGDVAKGYALRRDASESYIGEIDAEIAALEAEIGQPAAAKAEAEAKAKAESEAKARAEAAKAESEAKAKAEAEAKAKAESEAKAKAEAEAKAKAESEAKAKAEAEAKAKAESEAKAKAEAEAKAKAESEARAQAAAERVPTADELRAADQLEEKTKGGRRGMISAGIRIAGALAIRVLQAVSAQLGVRIEALEARYKAAGVRINNSTDYMMLMMKGLRLFESDRDSAARQNLEQDIERHVSNAFDRQMILSTIEKGSYTKLSIENKQIFLNFMFTQARIFRTDKGLVTGAEFVAFNIAMRNAYFGEGVADPQVEIEIISSDEDMHGRARRIRQADGTIKTIVMINANKVLEIGMAIRTFSHELGHAIFNEMHGEPSGGTAVEHLFLREGIADDFADFVLDTLAEQTMDEAGMDHGFDLYSLKYQYARQLDVQNKTLGPEYFYAALMMRQMRGALVGAYGAEKGMALFYDFLKNGINAVWSGAKTLEAVTEEYLSGITEEAKTGEEAAKAKAEAEAKAKAEADAKVEAEAAKPLAASRFEALMQLLKSKGVTGVRTRAYGFLPFDRITERMGIFDHFLNSGAEYRLMSIGKNGESNHNVLEVSYEGRQGVHRLNLQVDEMVEIGVANKVEGTKYIIARESAFKERQEKREAEKGRSREERRPWLGRRDHAGTGETPCGCRGGRRERGVVRRRRGRAPRYRERDRAGVWR